MFWDRFYSLCAKNGIKPNPLGQNIGISSGIISKWKKGNIPNGETLLKIANYFNCSIDYLLERVDDPALSPPTESSLRSDERLLLDKYRQLTDTQRGELMGYLNCLYNHFVDAAGGEDTEIV